MGIYRDDAGETPILRAIKAAERRLAETQPIKAYLGVEGDARFVDLLAPIVFGAALAVEPTLTGVQAPMHCVWPPNSSRAVSTRRRSGSVRRPSPIMRRSFAKRA